MSKIQSLQNALERSVGRPKPATTNSPEKPMKPASSAAAVPRMAGKRQAGREGKFNLSSWQPMAFKSGLRLVQAHKGGNATIEGLMAEALNELFIKYKVPTVSRE